ncbi:FeoB-associated Cys-rich membrane protein [Marinicella sp. W31]|uniref:FeoB-associated Cys-rich membrane protein n=1 Tax=Marinicella sp. W31 TaxID=3023713 RepID=UPI003756C3D4
MRITLLLISLFFAQLVNAYVGPGAGIPIIGSLIGIIVTVVLVLAAILFWPIRKMLKKKKNNQ